MENKSSNTQGNAELEMVFTLFNEIGIVAQLSGNQFERVLPDGLTRSQFTILNWLCRVDDQATPGRLARALEVTRGAMTNSVKKLKSKGLVTVTPDETSGRQKIVRLTEKGRTIRNQSIAATHPLLVQMSEDLGVGQIKKILPFLQQIRVYLDERRY